MDGQIVVHCGGCGHVFRVGAKLSGRRTQCTHCESTVYISDCVKPERHRRGPSLFQRISAGDNRALTGLIGAVLVVGAAVGGGLLLWSAPPTDAVALAAEAPAAPEPPPRVEKSIMDVLSVYSASDGWRWRRGPTLDGEGFTGTNPRSRWLVASLVGPGEHFDRVTVEVQIGAANDPAADLDARLSRAAELVSFFNGAGVEELTPWLREGIEARAGGAPRELAGVFKTSMLVAHGFDGDIVTVTIEP